MSNLIKTGLLAIGAGIVFVLLIQLVPIDRTNPPVTASVKWDSPQTQALFRRACADCHSNETVWPWYSYVAPVSWLVAHDVSEGRGKFNLSEISASDTTRLTHTVEEVAKVMRRGDMPKAIYLPTHPEARLTQDELSALSSGLQKTLASYMK
jgi:hypothetical protein